MLNVGCWREDVAEHYADQLAQPTGVRIKGKHKIKYNQWGDTDIFENPVFDENENMISADNFDISEFSGEFINGRLKGTKFIDPEYGDEDRPNYFAWRNKDLVETVGADKHLYTVNPHKEKDEAEFNWLNYYEPIPTKQKAEIKQSLDFIFDKLKTSKTLEGMPIEYVDDTFTGKPNRVVRKSIPTIFEKAKTGKEVYDVISELLGGDKEASDFLQAIGIDGIKYPAESKSRGTNGETARGHNYVVFDDSNIDVKDKKVYEPQSDYDTLPTVYHGGDVKITDFNDSVPAKNRRGNVAGHYFHPDEQHALSYGKEITKAKVNLKNPFTLGKSEVNQAMLDAYRDELAKENDHLPKDGDWISGKVNDFKREKNMPYTGMSGEAQQRVFKAGGYDGVKDGADIVAFDKSQIQVVNDENLIDGVNAVSFEAKMNRVFPNVKNIIAKTLQEVKFNPTFAEHLKIAYGSVEKYIEAQSELAKEIDNSASEPQSEWSDEGTHGYTNRTPGDLSADITGRGETKLSQLDYDKYTIRTPQDVADIDTIFRNPRIEAVTILFVKNGKIVHHITTTSNNPYNTATINNKKIAKTAEDVGADTFFITHNHPSGNPTPSEADVELTIKKLCPRRVSHLEDTSKQLSNVSLKRRHVWDTKGLTP